MSHCGAFGSRRFSAVSAMSNQARRRSSLQSAESCRAICHANQYASPRSPSLSAPRMASRMSSSPGPVRPAPISSMARSIVARGLESRAGASASATPAPHPTTSTNAPMDAPRPRMPKYMRLILMESPRRLMPVRPDRIPSYLDGGEDAMGEGGIRNAHAPPR